MLRNGAKFIERLTPGFENHMSNLDNLIHAVQCYFCPKNTFLQLKYYIQRICLTVLSTTCVKIHQMSFFTPYVIFQDTSPLYFLSQALHTFGKSRPLNFEFSDFTLLALKFTKSVMSLFK